MFSLPQDIHFQHTEQRNRQMVKQASERGSNWFQDVKFGMFIHWGLYSLIGRGEWVMHWEKIPVLEYQELASQFNPLEFNADAWVKLAADAGQKYMVITSRHHDGFSMYNTALSDYKVTNTPFKRDPIAELAEACSRNPQVKLGFYVSLLDWHHPAYRFQQQSGLAWEDYLDFLHGQVRELCTNYGDLASFWFDGDWPRHHITEENAYFLAGGSFEYEKLYGIIRELQPDAVIHNNRHEKPLPGEDVQGFEQDLPGANTAGFNTTEVYGLPLEVCMTINDNWGIHFKDENHKSPRQLIHYLVRSASVGANYLLNVGPTASGVILPEHTKRLRQIGVWLKLNGSSIYGTRTGLIPATQNSVSTYKETPGAGRPHGTHFIHVLEYNSDCVVLREVPDTVKSAYLLRDGAPIKIEFHGADFVLTIPPDLRDPFDTVVVLDEI
jgi:alpha-L-fucosidase